jgi:hypothetical protein
MKLVRFPDWRLHNFQLEPFKLHRDELLLAMGTALPRVQSLCGLPHSDQGSACGFELLPSGTL